MLHFPEEITIGVSFSKAFSSIVCATILKETIKHHMYMRGQLPIPFESLEKQADDIRLLLKSPLGKKRPASPQQRRIMKAVGGLQALFCCVDELFSMCEETAQEILVIFGPSPQSPKEGLYLVFPQIGIANGIPDVDERAREYASKVVRSMLENHGTLQFPRLPLASRVHILARIKSRNSIATHSPCSFLVPQRFNIVPKRLSRSPIFISVHISTMDGSSSHVNKPDDALWFLLVPPHRMVPCGYKGRTLL